MAACRLHPLLVLLTVVPVQAEPSTPAPALRGATHDLVTEIDETMESNESMLTMEELLDDNVTLSSIVDEMEREEEQGTSWVPEEEEPENVTVQVGDEEDEADDGASIEETSAKSRGWFSIWYGGFGGIKRQKKICPRGQFIKSMKVVTGNLIYNAGVIRIQKTVCSRGWRLKGDGGQGPGKSTTFFSHRGFRKVTIFSGTSIRGLCMGGKCAGADGNRFKVKCRKGRFISGYRVRSGFNVHAIKFLCRKLRR